MMKLSARGAVSGGAQVLSFTARLIGGRQHNNKIDKKADHTVFSVGARYTF